MMTLDTKDIQGIVFSAFANQPVAAYLLLRVEDAARARRWLGSHLPKITPGFKHDRLTSLQVAFTSEGLRTMGLHTEDLATFPREFLEGMATESRSRILGDSESSAPSNWLWGGNAMSMPHILVIIFAPDLETLESKIKRYTGQADQGVTIVQRIDGIRTNDGKEHFGFADGMAQPLIDGAPGTSKSANVSAAVRARDVVPAGEFLLGYPDTYGTPSRGPTVASARDLGNALPRLPSGVSDLGKNGTYLVFRQLRQDVAALEKFLGTAEPDPAARELLAAKLVGRWRSGAPLVKAPNANDPGLASDNDFDYHADKLGARCPIGSHIRRANPRDSNGDDPAASLASTNRHRILRRGRVYGPRWAPGETNDTDRGLLFICLNADIQRQFEFVQQTWLNNSVFGGLCGERDPLLGSNDPATSVFTVPARPVRRHFPGLSRLVQVRAGAYFFMPGLRALRYLTEMQ
jgi:Dyp-type peroxidase family